jgi:anthranilate phosphoribosyltransferase
VTPEEFGMECAGLEAIAGGSAPENAKIIRDLLSGKKSAKRDVVLLNAAAALVAAERADSIAEGLPLAMTALDTGAAKAKLAELVAFTNAQQERVSQAEAE